jgi:hypothetical protein
MACPDRLVPAARKVTGTVALGQLQQCDHFVFRLHADHQLWDQSVKAGVGAECECGKWVVEASIFRDQRATSKRKQQADSWVLRIGTTRSFDHGCQASTVRGARAPKFAARRPLLLGGLSAPACR